MNHNIHLLKKLMLVSRDQQHFTYRLGCACNDPSCDIWINIEIDLLDKEILMEFYKKLIWWDQWHHYGLLHRIWKRIQASLQILFIGRIEMETTFLIANGDNLDSLLKIFQDAKKLFTRREETE
jgi:hypothetical protein